MLLTKGEIKPPVAVAVLWTPEMSSEAALLTFDPKVVIPLGVVQLARFLEVDALPMFRSQQEEQASKNVQL